MTGTKNLRPMRLWVYMLLFGALLASGCSTNTGEQALVGHLDAQGNSIPGWVAPFPGPSLHSKSATRDFIDSGGSNCSECHGADLTGGISKVSCFTSACHHNPAVTNWSDPAVHGASAKRAPGSSSFFSCQICHAKDFSGGGAGVSCFPCHTGDHPHPHFPWRGTPPAVTHTNTDPANAPVCDQCHHLGANSTRLPTPPAPAGTPPGCFNNTLCHGPEVGPPHILGATWLAPTSAAFHGLSAKQNLVFCQSCHGTPGTTLFTGGSAPTSCSGCHPAAGAHPTTWFAAPSPFPAYVASHRNAGNRAVACAVCHNVTGPGAGPMAGAPSCFSAAFTNADGVAAACHAGGPGAANHLVPFLDPVHLGVNTAGFNADCANCHAVTGASPVAAAPACQVCHTAGSPVLPGGSFGNCSSCHGSPPPPVTNAQPNGATYPNIAGAHAKHLALDNSTITGGSNVVDCDTCHSGLGFVTQAHYDHANARPGSNALRVEPGEVSMPPSYPLPPSFTYVAQSGTVAFDNNLVALSCSAIKCHGGFNPTPNWRTGTIVITANAGCRACHKASNVGTPQFNDLTNNVHPTHITHAFGRNIDCTTCHDPVQLTPLRHFGNLVDNVIAAGAARATIQAALGYNPPGAVSINSCNTGCH